MAKKKEKQDACPRCGELVRAGFAMGNHMIRHRAQDTAGVPKADLIPIGARVVLTNRLEDVRYER